LQHDPAAWRVAAAVGDQPCLTPAQGEAEVRVDDEVSLVLRGRPLPAADRRVVEAFAAQAAIALGQERLEERAAATCSSPPPTATNCWPPPKSPWTGSPDWSTTCWT
jgi:hypothetical protein